MIQKVYVVFFALFGVITVGSEVVAEEIGSELSQAQGVMSPQQCYKNGLITIGDIPDLESWVRTKRNLSNHCWHIKGQRTILERQEEWEGKAANVSNLREFVSGIVGSVAVGVTGGSIPSIINATVDAMSGFMSGLVLSDSRSRKLDKLHNVVEDSKEYKYVVAYFLSSLYMDKETTSFVSTQERKFEYKGEVVFFEIMPGLKRAQSTPLTLSNPSLSDPIKIYLTGRLVYKSNKRDDTDKIEIPFSSLSDPTIGTFNLSTLGEAKKYLTISTGAPRDVTNEEIDSVRGEDRVQVWIIPKPDKWGVEIRWTMESWNLDRRSNRNDYLPCQNFWTIGGENEDLYKQWSLATLYIDPFNDVNNGLHSMAWPVRIKSRAGQEMEKLFLRFDTPSFPSS